MHDGFCPSKLRSKKLIEESNKHLKDIEDTLKVSNHFHIDYNHDCYISGVLRASIKVILHWTFSLFLVSKAIGEKNKNLVLSSELIKVELPP